MSKIKLAFSLSLILASSLTAVLTVIFIAGCVKVSSEISDARRETDCCQIGEHQNLGNSPTLKDVIEAAEDLEASN